MDVGPAGSGATYELGFPVLQYRGLLDEVVPAGAGNGTHEMYCAAKVPTQWNTYAGDHLLGDSQAIGDVIHWLGDRFDGKRTSGNC